MKFVGMLVLGLLALAATATGVARATASPGDSIANALLASSGVQQAGTTATFADACDSRFEFWQLRLEQGDLVEITWGANAAVDKLALWPTGTTDSAYGASCIYNHGWGTWNVSPVLEDSTITPGTPLTSHTTVNADGTYPLVFVNSTLANSGPYSFTPVVLHAAGVDFQKQTAIPGEGTFTAAVSAPDGDPIGDASLKLTLNAYWGNRTHKLATGTASGGLVKFDYGLPPSLWGKKIRLDITGAGASYQPVASYRETVKVLLPTPVVTLTSTAELRAASKLLRQPIYWAGRPKGYRYEFTRLANGWVYVRYLPHGVRVGDPRGKFLIVATYPLKNAYAAVKALAKGKPTAGPHGSIYAADPAAPKSVFVAFPHVNYEIEVYDPSPKVSRAIAASGRVRPVG